MAGKVEGKGQSKVLTSAEVEQVLTYAREPYRTAIAIAAYTGCRMGEAIAPKGNCQVRRKLLR
ncbi:hypothetical protein H6F93_02255 [Leptolyngbya sp. FACHB-671]|uniref:hypothetical protein n=1 Tax=Leptolyngbya sp. FACHB-671 TaxID=2692812 RepID=UPI0016858F2B|nr:hypothetical protein [Leptolyngbya sp. FACHB-671]MBD2066358.1 hypothetical protein [Leptolyngbya sp. FACHB-671]